MPMFTIDNLIVMALYVGALFLCRLVFEYPRFPLYLFLCGLVCLLGNLGVAIGLCASIIVPFILIVGNCNVSEYDYEDKVVTFRPWVRSIVEWFKNSELRKFLLK